MDDGASNPERSLARPRKWIGSWDIPISARVPCCAAAVVFEGKPVGTPDAKITDGVTHLRVTSYPLGFRPIAVTRSRTSRP